jgi:hypothetical protein
MPPENTTYNALPTALANDTKDLFVGVGNRVYRYSLWPGVYELLATIDDDFVITKLLYNGRNNHLWIYGFDSTGTEDNAKVWRLVTHGTGEGTLSSSMDMIYSSKTALELFDYEYATGSYKYALVYRNNGEIRQVHGTSMADTLILTQASNSNYFAYMKAGNEFTYDWDEVIGGTKKRSKLHINGSGAWVDDGEICSNVYGATISGVRCYHEAENRLYYFDYGQGKLYWISPTSTGEGTLIETLTPAAVDFMQYIPAQSRLFFTAGPDGYLYEAHDAAATKLRSTAGTITRIGYGFTEMDGMMYGLDEARRLYQYGETLALYVPLADFSGQTMTDALFQLLRGFNLVCTINSYKKAKIFRRGDMAGEPTTTAHTLELTVNEASEIVEENADYGAAMKWVQFSNGTVTWNYNGTDYQTRVFSDVRTLDVTNKLIPDEIVQDVCYYAYQFFKTDRVLYTINLGLVPLFQYEPLDNCQVTFTGTKIEKSGSGPLYSVTLMSDGSMEVQVVI